ncbi:MAG: RNA polymerase sigma factor [Deltaproteobacteria bacterium]
MASRGLSKSAASQSRRAGVVHSEMALETDADLVEALQRGDAGAAGRVYDRYVASVHGMVYRLLGRESDLEDLVQDIFVYALLSIKKLREPAALKGWLLGIATGKARSYIRRRWRQRWLRFLPQEELHEFPEDSDPHLELLNEVYSVLDQLPAEERIAWVLRRIEGLSLQEAAKTSGMSLSTFKRRLARAESRFDARARLRPELVRWLHRGPS